jgi:tetratricopeptide (TPR) repeat protein
VHDPIGIAVSATHLTATLRGEERCRRPLAPTDADLFAAWIQRYGEATEGGDHLEIARQLRALGGELWRWLDGDDRWLSGVRDESPHELWFEFRAGSGGDRHFLDVPWELLDDDAGFLAGRETLSFSVVRRLAPAQPVPPPSPYRPSVVFMAADPRDNPVPLDYDAEEQAILTAVGAAGIDFLCEDTGNLASLARRIREETEGEARVDIVHLSCHGNLLAHPVLALETELGEQELAGARELDEEFGDFRPRVLFLSACTTAEPDRMLGSLAAELAARRFPCVIGWAGKVSDRAATRFAAVLYQRLAARDLIESAVAHARRVVARDPDKLIKSEWHKARVFLGAHGGGPVTKGDRRRYWHDADRADQEFLDKANKKIPVASRQEFVGRRRPIQDVLRSLRQHRPTVIHGLGQHGKSSLANRIASRLPSHDLVVVFGDYTPHGILRAIREATASEGHDGAAEVRRILDEAGTGELSAETFTFVLGRLLKGPLRQLQTDEKGKALQRPILLVVDDFERALEPVAGARHRVVPELAPGIAALVTAFARTGHDSLLLITSRYEFACDVAGKDSAKSLRFIQLPHMPEGELRRQTLNLARQKAAEGAIRTPGARPEDLKRREEELFVDLAGAVDVAFGSPSLMSRVARLRAENAEGFARFKQAAQEYRDTGKTDEQGLLDFLEYVAIGELLGLLEGDEHELLRRATVFQLPAPIAVLARLHPRHHADATAAIRAVERLIALGLLNRFENPLEFREGHNHALIDPLVRPKLESAGPADKSDAEASQWAVLVCKPLFEAWGGATRARERPLPLNSELTRLGLLARDAEVLVHDATKVLGAMHFRHSYIEAAALGVECLTVIDQAAANPPFQLLRYTALSRQIIGDVDSAQTLLYRALEAMGNAETEERAQALAELGELLHRSGKVGEAEQYITEAIERFTRLDDERQATVASGRLADILQARGRLDEALAIRREKELPVFERLGDVRELAITHGQIADILQDRGQLDEALAIRREKQLPVYERLGAVRELVVSRVKIAMALLRRGRAEDVEPALEHLAWSHQSARRLGLREADQIEGILRSILGDAEESPGDETET